MRRPFWLPLLVVMFLSGCGADLNSPGEALQLFASTAEPAYLNEDYTFDFVVQGGLAPYSFKLRDGALPPGVTLENGTLSGTPTKVGRYTFTLMVSDANLSQAIEDYTIEVTTAPPAKLVLNVPPTTVSDTVRIPVTVEDARSLQALRTQITWDAALFRFVEDSVEPSQNSVALLQRVTRGQLNVDLAFLGPSLNGNAELFSFELEPVEPSAMTLSARTEYRSRDGEHGFSSTEDSTPAEDIDEENDTPTDENLTDTGVEDGFGESTGSSNIDNDGDDYPSDIDPNDNDPSITPDNPTGSDEDNPTGDTE